MRNGGAPRHPEGTRVHAAERLLTEAVGGCGSRGAECAAAEASCAATASVR